MHFKAQVLSIQTNKTSSFISFKSALGELACISLQAPLGLKVGAKVFLGFKSADVLLSLTPCALLGGNELTARVLGIKQGEILSALSLECADFIFEALLDSFNAAKIAPNDEIFAYISHTSLYIDEVLC